MLINIADLKNPKTGLTYREENNAQTHEHNVGALVEVINDETMKGVRLYVVKQNRDCDGTPLYCLAPDKTDTEVHREGFANRKWLNGISEQSIIAVNTNE